MWLCFSMSCPQQTAAQPFGGRQIQTQSDMRLICGSSKFEHCRRRLLCLSPPPPEPYCSTYSGDISRNRAGLDPAGGMPFLLVSDRWSFISYRPIQISANAKMRIYGQNRLSAKMDYIGRYEIYLLIWVISANKN